MQDNIMPEHCFSALPSHRNHLENLKRKKKKAKATPSEFESMTIFKQGP